jgi:intracellular sulfur oxidation DsrE/DsrF family protein
MQHASSPRRPALSSLLVLCAIFVLGAPALASDDFESLRFPGDPAENKVVYQFNKADPEYHAAVMFSVGAMLRQYTDNIDIAVVAIGPGIHILAKNPQRPVSEEIKQRVSSLSQYGVRFIACGNTMKALGWTEEDILPLAEVTEVGAAELMELQQEGYAYISW